MFKIERLRYLIQPRPYRLEKPVVLQFPAIDICNSRCQMCFIWKNKAQPVVTPEAIRAHLSDPLFDRVRVVGINGGEPTLRKDLGELAESLFTALPRLNQISIITNAFRAEEVKTRIAEVGDVVARHGGTFDVMISLDGVGDVHDRVRGKPGNFERAIDVLETVRRQPTVNSIRIGCTVIKENVYGVHDLFDFCRREDLYVKYRLGIPHRRLYTQNETLPFALDDEERLHFTVFLEGLIRHYETDRRQRYFYRSLIDQLMDHAPRRAGCDWQHRAATLTARGELLFCAVESDAVAHLEDADPSESYFSASARAHLDDIRRTKCADCTHDYMGLPGKKAQLAELADTLLTKLKLSDFARNFYAQCGAKRIVARIRFAQTSRRLSMIETSPNASRQPPGVMVCGWYGTETLGDKAILGTVVESLKAAYPASPITVASLDPHISKMTKANAPELANTSVMPIEEAIARAGEAQMVVFGGGPLMAINEMLHMRAIFQTAARAGVPRVIAGCGVGPLGPARYAGAIRDVLNLANLRIFRDKESRDRAVSLGVSARDDAVSEDPAYAWVLKRVSTARQAAAGTNHAPHPGPTLALGLRAFPWSQYADEMGRKEGEATRIRTDEAIVTALEGIVRRIPEIRILPIPMCVNHHGDDDRWYYRDLFRGRAELLKRLDSSLLGRELPSDAYLAAYACADAVLAMRFHALVFAIACGVPCVAIDYTMGKGKVASLANSMTVQQHRPGRIDPDRLIEELSICLTGQLPRSLPPRPKFPEVFAEGLANFSVAETAPLMRSRQ